MGEKSIPDRKPPAKAQGFYSSFKIEKHSPQALAPGFENKEYVVPSKANGELIVEPLLMLLISIRARFIQQLLDVYKHNRLAL